MTTATHTAEVQIVEPIAPANGGGRFALVVSSGDQLEVIQLAHDTPIVIGRAFPAQVHVNDERASRQHARFVLKNREVVVEDLSSKNGTFVNGRRIKEGTLVSGDQVNIGNATVTLLASRESPHSRATPERLIIQNEKMLEAYALARRVARTDASVLVLGETGTGKEHMAMALHAASTRSQLSFRPVNCAAIPEKLTESVLFGHERGAFTGADRRSAGVFEDANGGTLFLDEVGELSRGAQAALLRALETKRISRVGGTREVEVDVRIVSATHCELGKMIGEGSFRKDLLYRLNTVTIDIPPLRERPDELEPLVQTFLERACAEWGLSLDGVSCEAMQVLRQYDWPGNIRQLRNVIERASLAAEPPFVRPRDLPRSLLERATKSPGMEAALTDTAADEGLADRLRDFERRIITDALARAGGSRPAAAKLLRVPLRTLYRRIQMLGLTVFDNEQAPN